MLVCLAAAVPAADAESLEKCEQEEVRLYLALAEASEAAYNDSQPGLESTPSGCVALIREDEDGNLVVAFRGSLLGDRVPKRRFSNFGGANIRRGYRDWVATNLKQTAGFLPRQYTEAALLLEKHVRAHPVDKLVFVTGHSKGGGAAAYAFVAAALSANLSGEQRGRVRCVTFNAAVIREKNWRRLFRGLGRDAAASVKEPAPGSITSLVMAEDPVSRIGAAEERKYVARIRITPATALAPGEQHAMGGVIAALEKALLD